MSYSLSKIGMDVFIPIRKTLLDIALALLRPMNLASDTKFVTIQILQVVMAPMFPTNR